jgi:putative Mn2+ efflux pump MntP
MITLPLFLLAVALAMDAFAAAVAQGTSGQHGFGAALRTGGAFGLAQGLMPLGGWGLAVLLGYEFTDILQAVDHWVALVLLSWLGVNMAREGLAKEPEAPPPDLSGWTLFAASIATSIDAAIAGITLPTFEAPVLAACALIGAVTAILSFAGVWLGKAIGIHLGRMAEVGGGVVLAGLGVKIFVEHQFLGG